MTAENPIHMIRISLIALVMMMAITGMTFAQTTVVDVVVNSADHKTLETAVIAAELGDDSFI